MARHMLIQHTQTPTQSDNNRTAKHKIQLLIKSIVSKLRCIAYLKQESSFIKNV